MAECTVASCAITYFCIAIVVFAVALGYIETDKKEAKGYAQETCTVYQATLFFDQCVDSTCNCRLTPDCCKNSAKPASCYSCRLSINTPSGNGSIPLPCSGGDSFYATDLSEVIDDCVVCGRIPYDEKASAAGNVFNATSNCTTTRSMPCYYSAADSKWRVSVGPPFGWYVMLYIGIAMIAGPACCGCVAGVVVLSRRYRWNREFDRNQEAREARQRAERRAELQRPAPDPPRSTAYTAPSSAPPPVTLALTPAAPPPTGSDSSNPMFGAGNADADKLAGEYASAPPGYDDAVEMSHVPTAV